MAGKIFTGKETDKMMPAKFPGTRHGPNGDVHGHGHDINGSDEAKG